MREGQIDVGTSFAFYKHVNEHDKRVIESSWISRVSIECTMNRHEDKCGHTCKSLSQRANSCSCEKNCSSAMKKRYGSICVIWKAEWNNQRLHCLYRL